MPNPYTQTYTGPALLHVCAPLTLIEAETVRPSTTINEPMNGCFSEIRAAAAMLRTADQNMAADD
jgi:hypothetical protein